MTPDVYLSFADLARSETEGRDFRISSCFRGAPVTVLAPHGGRIEPGTSGIARLIAGKDCNWYLFEGMKASGNRRLHITSHRFDEPECLTMIERSALVVTVHALKGAGREVRVGGLARDLARTVTRALNRRGIPAGEAAGRLRGARPDNLCNRGKDGRGVQLEISRGLRDDPACHTKIAKAVREAIEEADEGSDRAEDRQENPFS